MKNRGNDKSSNLLFYEVHVTEMSIEQGGIFTGSWPWPWLFQLYSRVYMNHDVEGSNQELSEYTD